VTTTITSIEDAGTLAGERFYRADGRLVSEAELRALRGRAGEAADSSAIRAVRAVEEALRKNSPPVRSAHVRGADGIALAEALMRSEGVDPRSADHATVGAYYCRVERELQAVS
jgi:hypothetical protein